jgi:hypothetical protein
MEYFEKLLQLPYQTLAILAAGYLAYRLAYVGRDSTHQTIDTVAIVLVFAFIAQATSVGFLAAYRAVWPVKSLQEPSLWVGYVVSVAGLLSSVLSAAVWRRASTSIVPEFLRRARISAADRNVAAWQTIINREDSGPSAITVVKTDGSAVMCERLDDYKNEPFGPVVLGQDGSVALYVTSSRAAGTKEWIDSSPFYEDWGPEITIISASEISEVRIRHNPSLLGRRGRNRSAGKRPSVVRDVDGA